LLFPRTQHFAKNSPMGGIPYIVTLTVLGHIAFTGSRLAVSLFAIEQNASALSIGVLMSLFALLPALLSIQTGRWVDRVGVKGPMILGSLIATAGCLVAAFATGLTALQLTSALVGTGFMIVGICVYQVVGDLATEDNRATQFSLLAIGFSVGGFTGPLVSGIAIDLLSHQRAFLVMAVFAILPAIAMLVRPIQLPARHTHRERPDDAAILDLFHEPQLRRVYASVLIFSVAWDVYNFALPIHGVRIGLSASQIGIVMGTFAAATFAVRLAMPWIADHMRPWTVIMASCAVSAAAYAAMPFAGSVILLMLLLFALGLGLGAPQPMVLAILHDAAPPGRSGEAVGVRILLINGCQTVMPLFFGMIGTLGMLPVFWATAGFLMGGGWLARQSRAAFAAKEKTS
jgi:MFS family permease